MYKEVIENAMNTPKSITYAHQNRPQMKS